MYSEKIILQKLERFQAKYGWLPIRHSLSDVIEMNAYIKSLNEIGKDGLPYFDEAKLTPKLKRWIDNERAMCAIDCAYYLTRYHFISADNQIMRFTFRSGQRVFYSVCSQLEEQGKSIQIQVLKARQQGMSTLVEGMMTHRALFVPGVKCSIASANDQKTIVMLGMMYTALEHLPWWLPPKQTKDRRSGAAILEFAHIGSSVVVQSGAMRGGIGQGTTPTSVHLSEVADYTNPEIQIEEGLFRAIHPSPEILMILESTGNGNTNWWAELWKTNKENYITTGTAQLIPVFIPWFMTPELYPTQTWLRENPLPANWEPVLQETRAMTAKCEAYARNTKIIRDALPPDWSLPITQQWFWETKYIYAKKRRLERSWIRHMPCDDIEALIGEHDMAFDWDTLTAIDKHRERGYSIYGILGEGIAEKHDPLPIEVDPLLVRRSASWTDPKGQQYEWFFMPLICQPEHKDFDPLKKLFVYEYPKQGADYAIGVDTAQGGGGLDRSVISVAKTGRDSFPDIQVAEFACDDITVTEIYAYVAAIAAFYGQYMEPGFHPKLCIEQRRKAGDTCQHQLILMGMKRHHVMIAYDRKTNKPKPGPHSRLGFFTGTWSRPMLLNVFKYAIEGGWYVMNSKWLLNESENFEQKENTSGKTRMDHQHGKHDDRIFAAAMSYFTMHDLDVMIERSKLKYNSTPEDNFYVIDYSPFYPQAMSTTSEEWDDVFGRASAY